MTSGLDGIALNFVPAISLSTKGEKRQKLYADILNNR
jgi:hypothetical protein